MHACMIDPLSPHSEGTPTRIRQESHHVDVDGETRQTTRQSRDSISKTVYNTGIFDQSNEHEIRNYVDFRGISLNIVILVKQETRHSPLQMYKCYKKT